MYKFEYLQVLPKEVLKMLNNIEIVRSNKNCTIIFHISTVGLLKGPVLEGHLHKDNIDPLCTRTVNVDSKNNLNRTLKNRK